MDYSQVIITMIVLILLILSVYSFKMTSSKLKELKPKLDDEWNLVKKLIDERFKISLNIFDNNSELINLVNRKNSVSNTEEIMNIYFELEKLLNSTNNVNEESKILLKDNFEKLDSARQNYNNDVLKMNNIVKSFPSVFTAKTLGYKKWIYFRKEN